MGRRATTVVAGTMVLAVMAGGCTGGGTPQEAASAKTVTVEILVQCTASPDSTFIRVTPWEAKLSPSGRETLVWVVDTASTIGTAEIELKQGQTEWPLDSLPPYGVGKGNPRGGQARANLPPRRRYPYNIRATCTPAGDAAPRVLVIDPDIIVN